MHGFLKVFDSLIPHRNRADEPLIVLILYALGSVASLSHIWSTMRLCAFAKQAPKSALHFEI